MFDAMNDGRDSFDGIFIGRWMWLGSMSSPKAGEVMASRTWREVGVL